MSRHSYVAGAAVGFARAPIHRGRLAVVATALGLVLAACSSSPTASPTASVGATASAGSSASVGPTTSAGPSPSELPGGGRIVLDRAPAGLACDAIGVEYRSVTFFIDPATQPQVWAVTDKGGKLSVRWGPSFVGGPAADPSVLDATGAVVARPREVLVIPQGAWPNLHGHFACPSPTALYILDEAPPQ